MKKFVLLISFFYLLVLDNQIYAQISISPLIIQRRLSSIGFSTITVSVLNESTDEYNCDMIPQNMMLNDQGMAIPDQDENRRSCASWIEFSPKTFRLRPEETRNILVKIRIPRDEQYQGGYYALLTCESFVLDDSRERRSGAIIQFSSKVSSVLMLTIKGARLHSMVQINKLGFSPVPVDDHSNKGWSVVTHVQNSGNLHINMEGEVTIRGRNGVLIDKRKMRVGRGYVFPESERIFKTEGDRNLGDGYYIVRAEIRPQGAKKGIRTIHFAGKYIVKNGKVIDAASEEFDMTDDRVIGSGFSIESKEINIMAEPGAKRFSVVRLKNLTDNELQLIPDLCHFSQREDGSYFVIDTQKDPYWADDLIDIREQTIQLRPRSSYNVRLQISLPRTLDKEMRSLILFTRQDQSLSEIDHFEQSVKCYIRPRRLNSPEINILNFEYKFDNEKRMCFNCRIKNISSHRVWVDGTVIIRDRNENMIGDILPISQGRTQVLPLITRDYDVNVDRILSAGVYYADLTVNCQKSEQPKFQRIQLVIP